MYRRMGVVFFVIIAMFTGLIMRLYAITQTGVLSQAAHNQSSYLLEVGTSRGQIYDCNFTPLVGTEQRYVAAVLPCNEAAATLLARTDIVSERRGLLAKFEDGSPFLYEADERGLYSKGIDVFAVRSRYSQRQIAANIIGYLSGDGAGVTGVEQAYNAMLAELSGKLYVRYSIDAAGRPLTGTGAEVVEQNYNSPGGVVLTLDADIQALAEQAAAAHFERGAVVVMDVYSGELKALVSTPALRPTDVASALDDPASPLINRPLWDYSVGSSFKMLVAATAIEQGLAGHMHECTGSITVGDVTYNCHNTDGHSWLNMRAAMERSCNPYFISLALRLGGEAIAYKASQLGFGSPVELAPGLMSASGVLPTYAELGSAGEVANFGFGQGKLMATPLQIAQMTAAIANGGGAVTPKLVVGFTEDGATISEYTPTYAPTQVITPAAAIRVQEYLVSTVENGSGRNARPYALGAGGKTGSAQTGQYNGGEEIIHAWFTGFFPAQQPQYAVVVLAEGMDSGGDYAAPAFKEICDGMLMRGKIDGYDAGYSEAE